MRRAMRAKRPAQSGEPGDDSRPNLFSVECAGRRDHGFSVHTGDRAALRSRARRGRYGPRRRKAYGVDRRFSGGKADAAGAGAGIADRQPVRPAAYPVRLAETVGATAETTSIGAGTRVAKARAAFRHFDLP